MENIEMENLINHLAAIRPIYIEGKGKGCEIYLNDGSIIIDKREASTIVKDLAGYLAVDLGSLKKFCSHRLTAKNSLPLPLTPKLMLVPLRLRKPKVIKDSATGYVNFFSIVNIQQKGRCSHLHLTGDSNIICFQTLKTIQVHLVYSRLIYREWQSVYVNPYVKEVGKELYKTAKLDLIRNIMGEE
ncbi:hypothetical protein HYG86_15050 [Alkalicella caledoniensis]|uniref:ComK protein n=1 Tax=Alkalicella caledoniensis TaxID=2731377 RepID=A0A7G9WBC9_ALKCA|nr:hypothetical protein [Alkalicella caledoniensis]QNO15991.1 hypothetical protein HYG86_15050 [Alkalicella caledoniensis]